MKIGMITIQLIAFSVDLSFSVLPFVAVLLKMQLFSIHKIVDVVHVFFSFIGKLNTNFYLS